MDGRRNFARSGWSIVSCLLGGQLQAITLGFAGATLTMEAPFNGTLIAPNANVAFGAGSGLAFSGSFFGRTLEVRPQSTLICL